jgi:hypothetical protein
LDGSITAIVETTAASGVGIPLDLAPLLSPYGDHGKLSIKVERLPLRARLSKGRNNGDHSWSLTPGELDDLLYQPPAGLETPHTLIVKIISLDSDSASTLVQLDVPVIPGDGAATTVPEAVAHAGKDEVPSGEVIALEAELAAVSEELNRLRDESGEQTARHTGALQQQAAEAEARFAETLECRLSDAHTSWEAEQQNRITIAVQAAVDQARKEAGTETRAQLEQTNEARLSQELGRRLADAKASWEAEQQNHTAAAMQEAVQRAEQETTARLEQSNEARLAQELGRQLADARTAWEAEQNSLIAVTVQDAVRQAEENAKVEQKRVNDARLFEELGRRLADARALWDNEQKADIAAAVQQAEALAQKEQEQARVDWQAASAQELTDLSARCEQAEAALEAAHRQPLPLQESEEALHGLRDELEAAQESIRAREAELTEARQELERSTAEYQSSTTQSFREAELEFRLNELLAETEASLKESRAAWDREREEILANAEEIAQQRVDQAFEQWQQETQAALSRAQQDWMDSEATRLAVAEAHWRKNIGIVKSRGPITELTNKRRQRRINGRVLRMGAIAACLAGAIMLYPYVAPFVAKDLWPEIAAQKDRIEPSIRKAGGDIQSWLTGVMDGADVTDVADVAEPRAAIDVAAANVRAGPSTNAAVIMTLPRNRKVTPIGRRGSWVQVRIGGAAGKTGWLHSSLLKNRTDP